MATLDDVARHAGVSAKTVSRVVNGVATVAPNLRAKVEDAIRELDYRPSLAARQLASRRSYLICAIIPRQPAEQGAQLLIEIAAQCRTSGFHLVTEVVDTSDGDEPNGLERDFAIRPDAVILLPPLGDDRRLLERLDREGIRTIRVNAFAGTDGIVIRLREDLSACDTVRHMIEKGHRRIGMVGPPRPEHPGWARAMGYRQALAGAGIAEDPALLALSDMTFSGGVKGGTQLLALSNRPTAIFAASDPAALGVLAVARRGGYAVPQDLAIAGFGGSPECEMVFPPLTTVCTPVADIARAAVDAATGRAEPRLEFTQELVIRGSTSGDRSL